MVLCLIFLYTDITGSTIPNLIGSIGFFVLYKLKVIYMFDIMGMNTDGIVETIDTVSNEYDAILSVVKHKISFGKKWDIWYTMSYSPFDDTMSYSPFDDTMEYHQEFV